MSNKEATGMPQSRQHKYHEQWQQRKTWLVSALIVLKNITAVIIKYMLIPNGSHAEYVKKVWWLNFSTHPVNWISVDSPVTANRCVGCKSHEIILISLLIVHWRTPGIIKNRQINKTWQNKFITKGSRL